MPMRLGCCATIDQAQAVREAGFDFLEVNIQKVLQANQDDETWLAQAPDPSALALPIEAANSLIPGTMPILGDQRITRDEMTQYLRRVAQRAKRLGVERLVFGSGKARHRPEQMSEEAAWEQLIEFCRLAGDLFAEQGVVMVIEHLNQSETNTINSLADELALVRDVNHQAVGALVDSYHQGLEGDSDQSVLDLDGLLRHVHLAEPIGRGQPGTLTDPGREEGYDYQHLFGLLKQIGYGERISIEAKWTQPIAEAGGQVVDQLRQQWNAATPGG